MVLGKKAILEKEEKKNSTSYLGGLIFTGNIFFCDLVLLAQTRRNSSEKASEVVSIRQNRSLFPRRARNNRPQNCCFISNI